MKISSWQNYLLQTTVFSQNKHNNNKYYKPIGMSEVKLRLKEKYLDYCSVSGTEPRQKCIDAV